MRPWKIVLILLVLFLGLGFVVYSRFTRPWLETPDLGRWQGSWSSSRGEVHIAPRDGRLHVRGPEADHEGYFVPDQSMRVWQESDAGEGRRVLEWEQGKKSPVLRIYTSTGELSQLPLERKP